MCVERVKSQVKAHQGTRHMSEDFLAFQPSLATNWIQLSSWHYMEQKSCHQGLPEFLSNRIMRK